MRGCSRNSRTWTTCYLLGVVLSYDGDDHGSGNFYIVSDLAAVAAWP